MPFRSRRPLVISGCLLAAGCALDPVAMIPAGHRAIIEAEQGDRGGRALTVGEMLDRVRGRTGTWMPQDGDQKTHAAGAGASRDGGILAGTAGKVLLGRYRFDDGAMALSAAERVRLGEDCARIAVGDGITALVRFGPAGGVSRGASDPAGLAAVALGSRRAAGMAALLPAEVVAETVFVPDDEPDTVTVELVARAIRP